MTTNTEEWVKEFREIGFGNQAIIVGTKRVELIEWISHLLQEREEMWKSGDLLSNCCAWDFEPLGYEKEEGMWQERCLKCGKLCEPLYISEIEIKNIRKLSELTKEEIK